jgi:hypothetical protein
MGGADRITPGDRGQPLYVNTEQVGEGLGLGFTQLRELRCDVRDRAVVLAQLRTRPDMLSRGGVTLGAQGDGQ